MKAIILLFVTVLFQITVIFGQCPESAISGSFGQTKDFFLKEWNQKYPTVELTQGFTKEGYTYLMDDDSANISAWFFDDNSVCVAIYWKFSEGKMKSIIIELRERVGKGGVKLGSNIYQCGDFTYRFEPEANGALSLTVTRIE